MSRSTRRIGGLLIGAALAVTALTACGRSDAPAASEVTSTLGAGAASGDLTIWAMGAEGEALGDFVAGFEEANPDVNVTVTAIPWASAHDKFMTAVAAGTTPDLAMMGTTWMADFGDAFASVPTDLDTSDLFASTLDSNALGVPWYVDTRVLYYRTDLAQKAGWTTPSADWAGLKQMATDLQAGGADYGIRLPTGGNGSFRDSLWLPWSNGAELTNDDGTEWTLDTPEAVEAYDYLTSYFTDGIANADADNSQGANVADFVAGTTPMLIDGPAVMGQLEQVGGEDFAGKYATAVLPTEKSSTSFLGGSNLVVFKDSANPDAAWKLIDWMVQPETEVDWYTKTGDLPSSQSAWQDPSLTDDAKLSVFGTQLETAQSAPTTASWVEVSVVAEGLLEQMVRGTKTPADALAELQSKAEAIGVN